MAGLSFMQRRGDKLGFRKRMPKELAGLPVPEHVRTAYPALVNAKTGLFKREVTASLKTGERRAAATRNFHKAAEVLQAIEGAMRMLKDGPPSPDRPALPSLDAIEAEVFAGILAADDADLISTDERLDYQTEADRDAIRKAALELLPDEERALIAAHPEAGLTELEPGRGRAEDVSIFLEETLREEEAELRQALGRGKPAIIAGEVRSYLREKGVRFDPENVAHHEIALAVLRAQVRGVEAKRRRLAGEIVKTPKPPVFAKGPKLSEALASWEAGSAARGGKKPSSGAIREARLGVRRLIDLHGDLPLADVTPAKARAFRGALEKVPIRLTAKQRKLGLKALLDLDSGDGATAHGATVNKQLRLVRAVVSHAIREGAFDELPAFRNPFEGVSSAVDERRAEPREPFSEGDLKAIFGTAVFTEQRRPVGGAGEAAFWLPILALLTGCRREELVQLTARHVAQEDGVWRLDVSTSGGRSLKTASSRRKVPLHPALETIGFLSYLKHRIATGGQDADLWPALRSAAGRDRGASFSQWFGRFLRKDAEVTDPAKVFHSFRHTFKRLARDAELGEEMQDALTGHVGGGVGRTYGNGFGLKALSAGVLKIEAPAVVLALRWEPGGGTRRPGGRREGSHQVG